MTTYILHGGETKKESINNDKFFKRMTISVRDQANILLVYFARKESLSKEKFKIDKENFNKASKNNKFNFILASSDLDVFSKQVKSADVIYMHGNKTNLLLQSLSKVRNLDDLWKNKIIGGSSAGANVLSRFYYNFSEDKIEEGLGILSYKVFVHSDTVSQEMINKLRQHQNEIETIILPETEFKVIRK